MMAFVFAPEYIQWYMSRAQLPEDFAFLKRGLQYLQWQFNDGKPRPWVLKNPVYPGFEPLLASLFPDAALVTTHRAPQSILPSGISLLHYYHQAYSDASHREQLSTMLFEGHAMVLQAHLAARDANPQLNILDVGYSETIGDAEHVVDKIYAHAGMKLSPQVQQRLRNWENENRQHKHGVHSYTLEEFSLTQQMVNEKFKFYTDRFGAIF